MAWPFTTGTRSTPKTLPGDGGAVAQNPAQGGALAHLLHEVDGPLRVPELGDPRLHGHADGRAHLDGVEAVVVVQAVQHGDGVQIVDAAVRRRGPRPSRIQAAWSGSGRPCRGRSPNSG